MPPQVKQSKAPPKKTADAAPKPRPSAKAASKPAASRKKKPAAPAAAPVRRRREGVPAVTKRDIASAIAEQQDIPRTVVEEVLNEVLERIQTALVEGQPVEFRDFGVFSCITRRPRLGRNPKRPTETVLIPARRNVIFKPGKQLKGLVLKS